MTLPGGWEAPAVIADGVVTVAARSANPGSASALYASDARDIARLGDEAAVVGLWLPTGRAFVAERFQDGVVERRTIDIPPQGAPVLGPWEAQAAVRVTSDHVVMPRPGAFAGHRDGNDWIVYPRAWPVRVVATDSSQAVLASGDATRALRPPRHASCWTDLDPARIATIGELDVSSWDGALVFDRLAGEHAPVRVAFDDGTTRDVTACTPLVAEVYGMSGLSSGLESGIGGLIGARDTGMGVGGLGARGSGLGTAVGIGGLGSRGTAEGIGGVAAVGGEPIILGALDRSVLDEVVKRHMNRIQYCYQRELAENPALGGKIVIKFTIAKDGSVSLASIKSTTMNDPAVEQCLEARFLLMKFPEPHGGGIVIVSYPFVFSPG